ncbi:MAG: hypothetical protein A2V21_300815 [Deltaproteobacteria bacterium GWC2_55_46]|nr:MAG: hypothetical protein A2Z79_10390 [Deltaproteobacteria bacterium GWA2_55_82]OGQ63046.1 MAG: hypothetical protein A3I81_06575 [Deltaproteobacteria bacterium RIFCSPLOWO2_02_FULL_55_12]OIJ74993.1 MAG: hypothetical protein A2V21_300815 [Deltaproteobacteria bacterium GWC2_55_46]
MHSIVKYLSLTFSAGVFGALVNTFSLWAAGHFGLLSYMGVGIDHELPRTAIYTRIVWGGLWGFLFLVPFAWRSYALRGVILSIGPTLVQLFSIFPMHGAGIMGLSYGMLTPVAVFVLNAIWGMSAGIWLLASEDQHERPWFRKYYIE